MSDSIEHDNLYNEGPDLTQKELDKILENHKLWIESNGEDGEKADLSEKKLQGLSFEKAELKEAIFDGAVLIGADFSGANLENAMLMPSDPDIKYEKRTLLRGAKLIKSNLKNY